MPRKKRSTFSGAGAGDFFLCFTSRPSKRSPLSPGRAGATPSLSSSLSRRLRPSGSLRGAQSPMFPSGRRKGPAFDAPVEPSSPKVTCIGQVRVKSKKSKPGSMREGRGEASFRRPGDRKMSVGVCERIWGFGFEVNWNCLFSCCGGEREGGFGARERSVGACEGLVASWVVDEGVERELEVVIKERVCREAVEVEVEVSEKNELLESGEGGDGEEEEEEARISICIPPRNALLLMRCRSDPVRMAALSGRFWDMPAVDSRVEEEAVGEGEDDVVENADESIEDGVQVEEVDVDRTESAFVDDGLEGKDLGGEIVVRLSEDGEVNELERNVNIVEVTENEDGKSSEVEGMRVSEDKGDGGAVVVAIGESVELEKRTKEVRKDSHLLDRGEEEEEIKMRRSSSCSSADIKEGRRSFKWHMRFRESGRRRSVSSKDDKDKRRHSFSVEKEPRSSSFTSEIEGRRSSFCIERSRSKRRWSFCLESEDLRLEKIAFEEEQRLKEKEGKTSLENGLEETSLEKGSELVIEAENFVAEEDGTIMTVAEDNKDEKVDAEKRDSLASSPPGFEKEAEKSGGLPDCLLLMMYEPKLSMEVSKETWVCSTDFLRWHPNHPQYRPCQPSVESKVSEQGGGKVELEKSKEEVKINDVEDVKYECSESKQLSAPKPPPPPRPLPAKSVVDKKVKGNADMATAAAPALPCGPLVLTRCKSEPMRSSERLIPDACFWKDRHRPIGATGIGF